MTDADWEQFVRVLENQLGGGIEPEVCAYVCGIDPHGSMLSGRDLLSREECVRALLALPRLNNIGLAAPPAPPVDPACSQWVSSAHGGLTPRDYPALGVLVEDGQKPRFSVEELRRQCTLAPNAIRAAVEGALADPSRKLVCQAFRCEQPIDRADQWSVCAACLMGVYCARCSAKPADAEQVCRLCLLNARVQELPGRWLFDRRAQLRGMFKKSGSNDANEEANCWEVVIDVFAPQAARLCCTASSRK